MRKVIIGNWKCNPGTVQAAIALAEGTDGIVFRAEDPPIVAIAPPHLYLDAVRETIEDSVLAAQDTSWEDVGPHTGSVAPRQLRALGVKYVIVGHSERRAAHNETNEMCNEKIKAVLKAGMTPVLCVGELTRKGKTKRFVREFVKKQLTEGLKGVAKIKQKGVIIAYEPIWAIGNGKADTPADAAEMICFIKEVISKIGLPKTTPVLYGGSVNEGNAEELFSYEEIDGALVGTASLKIGELRYVIEAAAGR